MSEQHAETTTTRTWTEAPASANIKFRLNGFDTMLTLRADSGAELLPKLEAAMDWLAKKGAAPTASANGNGGRHGGRNGGNGQTETKVCPIHHTPMKLRRGKGGDTWYSHKAVDPDTGEEYWCRGEQKQG